MINTSGFDFGCLLFVL